MLLRNVYLPRCRKLDRDQGLEASLNIGANENVLRIKSEIRIKHFYFCIGSIFHFIIEENPTME